MDIYEKIDAIFAGEAEEKPPWAEEILDELREIKSLLKENQAPQKHSVTSYENSTGLYTFVKEFRRSMRADTLNNIYPTFVYKGKRLGVDFKGLLYDKESTRILPRAEAYKVYEYAYNQHKHGEKTA